jgi:integrase
MRPGGRPKGQGTVVAIPASPAGVRHSSATLLAAADTPEDIRQSRLGHSTAAMSRLYAGASEAQDRAAADGLGKALSG